MVRTGTDASAGRGRLRGHQDRLAATADADVIAVLGQRVAGRLHRGVARDGPMGRPPSMITGPRPRTCDAHHHATVGTMTSRAPPAPRRHGPRRARKSQPDRAPPWPTHRHDAALGQVRVECGTPSGALMSTLSWSTARSGSWSPLKRPASPAAGDRIAHRTRSPSSTLRAAGARGSPEQLPMARRTDLDPPRSTMSRSVATRSTEVPCRPRGAPDQVPGRPVRHRPWTSSWCSTHGPRVRAEG